MNKLRSCGIAGLCLQCCQCSVWLVSGLGGWRVWWRAVSGLLGSPYAKGRAVAFAPLACLLPVFKKPRCDMHSVTNYSRGFCQSLGGCHCCGSRHGIARERGCCASFIFLACSVV